MNLNFNANDYDPAQGGAICFPLGDYQIEITGATPKVVTNNPGAGYLELIYTVIAGDLRGMTHAHRLNLFNPSEIAKKIAHQELSAIAFAINRPYLQDSNQLIGGRLIATIGPQMEPNDKYSEIKKIKCLDGTLPVRPVAGQAPPQQTAPPQQYAAQPAPVAAAPWGAPPDNPSPAQNAAYAVQSAPVNVTAPTYAAAPQSTAVAPPWANQGPSPNAINTAIATPPWAK